MTSDSWWDDDIVNTGGKHTKVVVDAKNVVFRVVPDKEDNQSLLTLNTKVEDIKEDIEVMHNMLNATPLVRRTVNDESTISSNLMMDTRMDAVEFNIGNMENSVNFMSHTLMKFMKDNKQYTNTDDHMEDHDKSERELTNTTSTTVVEGSLLSDQSN